MNILKIKLLGQARNNCTVFLPTCKNFHVEAPDLGGTETGGKPLSTLLLNTTYPLDDTVKNQCSDEVSSQREKSLAVS